MSLVAARFAPDNRRRQQGSASRTAKFSQGRAKPTCYKGGLTRPGIVQRTAVL